jgi:hypothetical protein
MEEILENPDLELDKINQAEKTGLIPVLVMTPKVNTDMSLFDDGIKTPAPGSKGEEWKVYLFDDGINKTPAPGSEERIRLTEISNIEELSTL